MDMNIHKRSSDTSLACFTAQTDVLEVLDMAYNYLSGTIPAEFGDFNDAVIHFRNNSFNM
jgi:hypothetical protein